VNGTIFSGAITSTGNISAPNYQGVNSVDGYRASFVKGLVSNNVQISGSGGSKLTLGDTATPGGEIVGIGSTGNVPVNFTSGLNAKGGLTFPVIGTANASLSLQVSSVLPTLNNPSGFSGYFTLPAGGQRFYIIQPPSGYYVGSGTLVFISAGNSAGSDRMTNLAPTATTGTNSSNCGYFTVYDNASLSPAPLFQYFWLNLLN
jgi:hypothetical protein